MTLTVLAHGYFCSYMVMKAFQRGDDSHEGVLLRLGGKVGCIQCIFAFLMGCMFHRAVFNCRSIYK